MDAFIMSTFNELSISILFIIIVTSLFLLSKGADVLVSEAVKLSVRWGIPKMVIGATIVSLGTTLPEMTVSVMAALNGSPDLALGNAIGSVIANTALIIGIASLIGHLPIDKKAIDRQGPVLLGSAFLLSLVSLPSLSKGEGGRVSQIMGFIFIALLTIYLIKIITSSKDSNEDLLGHTNSEGSILIELFKLTLGLVLVIASSKTLIPAVEISAIRVGIPKSIIASTLVAFGTSLPELITAVTAVRKGHGELAIGNIIGANILNILFVIGSSAAVTKAGLLVPIYFYKLQIPAMLIILVVFYFFSASKNNKISKTQGSFMLAMYLMFLILNYTMV